MKIMSGRISMTQAQLEAFVQAQVAAAVAAAQAGQHAQQPVCTFKNFMDCRPNSFSGTEGAVGLLHWFEKLESVFEMCECPEARKVKYATGTLEGIALTWWNAQVQILGLAAANATPWNDFKELIKREYCTREDIHKLEDELYNLKMVGSEIEAYTKRSNELAVLCPTMVDPPYKRIEMYLKGLAPEIQSHVTSANLDNIQAIQRLAHRITDQAVDQNKLPKRVKATTTAVTTSATPVTTRGNGRGIPARDRLLFSLSNARQMTTRIRLSNHLAVRGRVDIGEFTHCVTSATNTTAEDVAGNNVKDASRWVMRLRIVEALGQQIRTSNFRHQFLKTRSSSNHSVETGDVSSVGRKVITNAIVLS
ncbi:putative retrotransposon gag domain-containing protein [Helianthus annuus]|uniref:Retrotransposon gag domain-containing protein n=1 Tax=Helianthus annuus TaxID=4232 RepID=A0A9K3IU54_HELAN|nr:putative retrotransposon gag domain-containing protein [Helianthus annuus]